MKIVIDISDRLYKAILTKPVSGFDLLAIMSAVRHGTPLPKGHGELIDADALRKKMRNREEELGDDRALWESSAVLVALDMFAPTIIEADKDGD